MFCRDETTGSLHSDTRRVSECKHRHFPALKISYYWHIQTYRTPQGCVRWQRRLRQSCPQLELELPLLP